MLTVDELESMIDAAQTTDDNKAVEYLAEEARTLVGQREAEARFAELDALKIDVERLEARIARLARSLESSDNA